MATDLSFDPITAVFEVNGWAVAHTTYPYRSRYAIAVMDGRRLDSIEGEDNQPLGMLLARFDPELLESYAGAIEQDAALAAEEPGRPDPDNMIRLRWLSQMRELVAEDAGRYRPAPFAEGRHAFDRIDSRGRAVPMPVVTPA